MLQNWSTKQHGTILNKIKIQYIDSIQHLFQCLACLNNHDTVATASSSIKGVIIDDLDYFIQNEEDDDDNGGGERHDSSSNYNDNGHESISKTLFHNTNDDDDNNNNIIINSVRKKRKRNEKKKKHDGKKNTAATPGSTTIEMMRLMQVCKSSHVLDIRCWMMIVFAS
jgi:hypothetical protein